MSECKTTIGNAEETAVIIQFEDIDLVARVVEEASLSPYDAEIRKSA